MKFRSFATLSATLFTAVFSAGACTSWLLHPETTESGMMVVHKINDARYSPRDADVRTAPNGRRWIRIGGYHRTHVNMAMNDKGVAVTTNGGDLNAPGHPRGDRLAIGAPQLETMVMQNCATAAEGVEVLKGVARDRLFFNSKTTDTSCSSPTPAGRSWSRSATATPRPPPVRRQPSSEDRKSVV